MERKSLNKTQILQIIKEECYKLDCTEILNVCLSKDATKKWKEKLYIGRSCLQYNVILCGDYLTGKMLLRMYIEKKACCKICSVQYLYSLKLHKAILYGVTSICTGMGGCFLLQGLFPNQGSNLGLLHSKQTLPS